MKSIAITLFLILALARSFAQDSVDFRFVEQKIRRVQPNGEVYYADYTLEDYYSTCRKYLTKSVVGYNSDTLYLSMSEMRFLQRSLQKGVKEQLPDSLFLRSHRLPKDSIIQMVEALNRAFVDSIQSVQSKVPPLAYFQYWAFSFSRPVYFRNSSWMVLYFMYYAHHGGEHGLAFYRKDGESWKLFRLICGGAW